MTARRFALALAFFATPALAVESLPQGVVACISQKDAQNYAKYVTESPAFAADLMARAACYVNKDNVNAVQTGKSGNFLQFKLLTGHKVWVAKDALRPAKPASAAR